MCNQILCKITYYLEGGRLNYKFCKNDSANLNPRDLPPFLRMLYLHNISLELSTSQATKSNSDQYLPIISQFRIGRRDMIIWIHWVLLDTTFIYQKPLLTSYFGNRVLLQSRCRSSEHLGSPHWDCFWNYLI